MNKSQKQIAGAIAIIGILAVSSIVAWEIYIIPPITPTEYDFVSIDDCETLGNISEPYQENITIALNSIACEGDYSISYSTSENLSSVSIMFNVTFQSNYSFIGFYFYVSNASNLELLNTTNPINLTIFNNESDNSSACFWQWEDFEVGCNNLTAEYGEINITDANVTNIVITIKSGDFVVMGSYAIDDIYALYEV